MAQNLAPIGQNQLQRQLTAYSDLMADNGKYKLLLKTSTEIVILNVSNLYLFLSILFVYFYMIAENSIASPKLMGKYYR